MKKIKLIAAFVALVLVSNLSHAATPNPRMEPESLATLVIEKLNNDVQLTDSQKVVLKVKFKEFIAKMEKADEKATPEEKVSAKQQAAQEYEGTLEGVLSAEQNARLKEKVSKREKTR